MKIKEGLDADWQQYVEVNSDLYGSATVQYAQRWAELMEERMSAGESIAEGMAKETSHAADTDGITVFMYGAAVSILSHFWEYGEELRQWHNLSTQIGDEGEKANEDGEVLNPALLSFGKANASK